MLDFLQQLFPRRGSRQAAGWQPAAAPTPAQAQRYAAWVQGRVYRNWLGPYFKAYHLLKGGLGNRRGPRVEMLREEGQQGALFFYDANMGPGNFRHLYELLSERITQLGYYRACHDRRQRQQQHLCELTVKQLFKPSPTDCAHSGRCNQRFGLVHLDLVSVNDKPLFIRLNTNPVQLDEQHFTPAQSFECLLAAVLDEPAADSTEQTLAHEFASL